MSRIAELREKANVTKRLHEQKTDRIRAAVNEVINSSSFGLQTAMAPDEGDMEKSKDFALRVTKAVASVVTDPINDFIDTCRARGLGQKEIEEAVITINNVFLLIPETKDKNYIMQEVASYMRDNPNLYDKIGALRIGR